MATWNITELTTTGVVLGIVSRELIILVLLIAINTLAFWQNGKDSNLSIFVCFLACPVDIVYGLYTAAGATLYDSTWIIGVMIAVLGTSFIFLVGSKFWGRRRK